MKDLNKHKFLLTEKAIQDLTSIWNYTFDTWSESQADKYYGELIAFCQSLADEPEVGKSYEQLISKLKGAKVNRHIIFYRIISESTIEIERVLHEQMELKSRLKR